MDYTSFTDAKLQAESHKAEQKIRVLENKLDDFKEKTEASIRQLLATKVEIDKEYNTRQHKPGIITNVDWKQLFAPVANVELANDWQRKTAIPGEVERVLALYAVAPGEFRHVSADVYDHHTGQPNLQIQLDDTSEAKLEIYSELIMQIIPHLASHESTMWFPAGVWISINSPRDLDDRRPDGAPDDEFVIIVRDDGKFALWETSTSCREQGCFNTLLEALQFAQSELAFDGTENDYDWEPFSIDDFKKQHGIK